MSWWPLRKDIERFCQPLLAYGFGVKAGSDRGWFGDGHFELARLSSAVALRIDRYRGQDTIEFAFESKDSNQKWYDVGFGLRILNTALAQEYWNSRRALNAKARFMPTILNAIRVLESVNVEQFQQETDEVIARSNREWTEAVIKERNDKPKQV